MTLFEDHIQDFGFDRFQTVVDTDSSCTQENRSVTHTPFIACSEFRNSPLSRESLGESLRSFTSLETLETVELFMFSQLLLMSTRRGITALTRSEMSATSVWR